MSKLAVIFPGIGYHCDKPLLYYGRDVAMESGCEKYINISYDFPKVDINDKEATIEASKQVLTQVEKQLIDVDWSAYDEVVFIAKSIGTVMANAYASVHELKNVKLVLLTPLVYTYQWRPKNAIAFIGTKDKFSSAERIIDLSNINGVPLSVYEGVNHSLECDDTFRNLEVINDVMKKISDFLCF